MTEEGKPKCVMCGKEAEHIAEKTNESLCGNCMTINNSIKNGRI